MPLPSARPTHRRKKGQYPRISPIRINQRLQTPPIGNQLGIDTTTPQLGFISNLILPLPTRSTITNPTTHRARVPLHLTQHVKRILIKLAEEVAEAVGAVAARFVAVDHFPVRMA